MADRQVVPQKFDPFLTQTSIWTFDNLFSMKACIIVFIFHNIDKSVTKIGFFSTTVWRTRIEEEPTLFGCTIWLFSFQFSWAMHADWVTAFFFLLDCFETSFSGLITDWVGSTVVGLLNDFFFHMQCLLPGNIPF